MSTNQKILAAVLTLIAALVGALTKFGGDLTSILGSGGAGGSGGSAVVVAGSSGASGRAGSASAGKGGAGSGGSSVAGAISPGPGSSQSWLSTQEWFVDPSWSNVKIFSSPGVISPQWVSETKSLGARVFRHMDTNATNNSKQVSWSTRRLPSDPVQTAYGAPDGNGGPGIAIEYQIDMCNALGSGCWFNIPHQADDNYIQSFAQLVSSRLNPTLAVYVEYSNETWNGQFSQFSYVNSQGVALKLPGMNQYYQGGAYTLYRGLQIGTLWKQIVPRTRYVFAFSGNYDIAAQALNAIGRTGVDMIAIAPYVGTNGNDAAGFSLTAWKSEVDKLAAGDITQARKIAGVLPLGFYEFGSTYYTNANQFDSQDAYEYMLSRFLPLVNAPACHYTAHSTCTSGSCWGGFTPALNSKGRALQNHR